MQKNLLTLFTFLLISTFAFGQFTSIGIIGTATPDGWDSDTDMTQDAGNPDLWTITMTLATGEAKFRADDDWLDNWGSPAFPSGTGTQGGENIPVDGGEFDITFNSATGEYSFTSLDTTFTSIGIIGSATPGMWDTDTDMNQIDTIPWVWTLEMTLDAGEVKFRADDDWAVSWGASDFPTGQGTLGGPNIPSLPGDYLIRFNTVTGDYHFETLIPVYSTIGLIGDATPGGWMEDTDLEQSPNDPSQWSGNMTLVDGVAKFRADDDWAVNWGGSDFPSGVGTQDGPDIPVMAGEYNVKLNTLTGEYSFDPPLAIFSSIGVIGSGTGVGWDKDIDMFVDPAQPDQWRVHLKLVDGVVKFRADDDWTVNWGDDGFPTGTGTQDGSDIPVFEGTWQIDFNATTGVYSFTPVSVGIVGPATPSASWDIDVDMEASDTLGSVWMLNADITEGEMKFRQDDAWTINWGAPEFPAGVGTQDGSNIMTMAGNYDITLNAGTGDYLFSGTISTQTLLKLDDVKVFPNPAQDLLTVQIDAPELQGTVDVRIMDFTGKVVHTGQYDVLENLEFDVSNYSSGYYILQISNNDFILGKRFVIAK